jgi:hypothetical protein
MKNGNTGADHFRYSNDEWLAIESFLAAHKIPTRPDDRATLETIVQNFVFLANRTDPRTASVKAAKRHWTDLENHLRATLADIEKLEALDMLAALPFALAENPLAQRAEFKAFKQKLVTAAAYAARATQGHQKSWIGKTDAAGKLVIEAGHHRARGELVDRFFGDLLAFWRDRGGTVGKSNTSPSTRFVQIVAGRVISETFPPSVKKKLPQVRLPGAITDFVRGH